uniref:Mothers against decapentaplegic homolog n=1 Tax=Syphacia muris TaxID=451379 RepID=A0A0N5AWD8_9BILA
MPCYLKFWCLLSKRRRQAEKLWRLRTIRSKDEVRSRRRFNRLLKAFDTEDLTAILKSVQSGGRDIKQCAPGPPMDIKEEAPECSNNDVIEEVDEEDDTNFQEEKLDTGLIPQIDKPMSMPYLCCKLWRWKDLQVDAALHRLEPLPWCRFGRVTLNNTTVSCCNPYHYALWIVGKLFGWIVFSESEPNLEDFNTSGYVNGGVVAGDHTMETTDTGFGDECTVTSFTTANNIQSTVHSPTLALDSSLSNMSRSHPKKSAWGQMCRWSNREKLDKDSVVLSGEFVAVGLLADAVYDGQNVCCNWDIENEVSFALIRQPHKEDSSCEEVWLYNSGTKPLFFSTASTLNNSNANVIQRPETIRRVTPGYCYKVHKFYTMTKSSGNGVLESVSPHILSTRSESNNATLANAKFFLYISVGKGWGENYHRIYHTDTPCRYEVTFVPNLNYRS